MKGLLVVCLALLALAGSANADDLPTPMLVKASPAPAPSGYDWSGFYAGGHLGVAWGNSNWTASPAAAPTPGVSGSFGLFQPIDTFNEAGSFFEGLQAGYNYMLPNRFVVGAETDASFPSFPNLNGISIGGTSTLFAPADRRGELQRDDARIRHGARPHRLRAWQLALLCDWRVCLGL